MSDDFFDPEMVLPPNDIFNFSIQSLDMGHMTGELGEGWEMDILGTQMNGISNICSPGLDSSVGSPEVLQSPPYVHTLKEGDTLQVSIFQRRRNKGPGWHPISEHENVRVTTGKGKLIKVDVETIVPVSEKKLKFSVVPCNSCSNVDSESPSSQLIIRKIGELNKLDSGHFLREVQMKIFRGPTSKVQVVVEAFSSKGEPLVGSSCEFFAHDDGRKKQKGDAQQPSRKRKKHIPAKKKKLSSPPPTVGTQKRASLHLTSGTAYSLPLGSGGSGVDEVPVMVEGDFHVGGIVRAHGFFQFSDIRLKTEIEDIVDAIAMIKCLGGKRYQWKNDNPMGIENSSGGLKVLGLIAQEVQAVVPEAVQEDESGYLSVAYEQIIPLLLEGFKQHLDEYDVSRGEIRDDLDLIKGDLTQLKISIMEGEGIVKLDDIDAVLYKMNRAVKLIRFQKKLKKGGNRPVAFSLLCCCLSFMCCCCIIVSIIAGTTLLIMMVGSMFGGFAITTVVKDDDDETTTNDGNLITGNDLYLFQQIVRDYPAFGALEPGWDEISDPCDWAGVECSTSNSGVTVTGIDVDLSVRGLTGPIPSEFGGITKMESLNLAQNQLTSTLPPEFSNIASNLRSLHLQGNLLDGTVPDEWALFNKNTNTASEMQTMDLSFNNLDLPFPSWLSVSQEPDFNIDLNCNNWSPTYPSWCQSDCGDLSC